MALSTGSTTTPTYGTTVLPFGTPVRVVARYDFVAGATNDTATLYVDPTSAVEASNTPYVAGTAANAPTVTVDNLAVADDFATAAAVPEPGAAGLLAAGGLLALRRRRRA